MLVFFANVLHVIGISITYTPCIQYGAVLYSPVYYTYQSGAQHRDRSDFCTKYLRGSTSDRHDVSFCCVGDELAVPNNEKKSRLTA